MRPAIVTGLFVYPVKSARGIALESAALGPLGLAHDRQFMVIDDTGRFVSQRTVPRLACVGTALEPRGVRLTWHGPSDATAPVGSVLLPFAGPAQRVVTSVWRSTCEGDVIDDATAWITAVCASPARVARFAGERAVNPRYARAEDRVQHADGYPVLVVNEGSRAALETDVGAVVPMDRFRANVVLSGWPAWAEDHVAELQLGQRARLALVKPCGRCAIVATDQSTGDRSKEPLATLARIRRDTPTHARLDASEDPKQLIPFGENAIVLAAGALRLGEPAVVTVSRSARG